MKARDIGIWFLKVGVSAGLLALIFFKVDLGKIATAFLNIVPGLFAIAVLGAAIFLFSKCIRWLCLVRSAGYSITLGGSAISFLGGLGLGVFTPGRMGEVGRVLYIPGDKLKLGGLVLVDKVFDLSILIALSLAGAGVLISRHLAIALSFVAAGGIFLLYFRRAWRALRGAARRLPFGDKFSRVVEGFETLGPKTVSACLVLTLFSFAVVLTQFYFVLRAFGSAVSASAVFSAIPLVILTNVFPITVGGLGVREGSAAFLLSLFGVPPEVAIDTSLLLFLTNTLLPGLVGIFFISTLRVLPGEERKGKKVGEGGKST